MLKLNTAGLKLPPRLIFYAMAGLTGMLLLIFLILVPRQQRLAAMDQKIAALSDKQATQAALRPFYTSLQEKLSSEEGIDLPSTIREKPCKMDMNRLIDTFEQLADASRVQINESRPDFDSLKEKTGVWRFHLVLQGDFSDFRKFLVRLGTLPCLKRIERMTFGVLPDSEMLTLNLKLSLIPEK
jgi:Tfp pilus assembly protein PilO